MDGLLCRDFLMISLRVLFRHAALVLVVVIASFATTIHTQRHASSIRGQTITARHTSSLWQRQLQWPEYASGNVRQPVKPIEPYWSNDYAPPDYRYSATAPQSKSKSKTAPLGQGSFVSSSVYCKVPYPGYGPIPPDLWLDQNGCLHPLPPTPPFPCIPTEVPASEPTPSPVSRTSIPTTETIPFPSTPTTPIRPTRSPNVTLNPSTSSAPSPSSPVTETPTSIPIATAPTSVSPITVAPSVATSPPTLGVPTTIIPSTSLPSNAVSASPTGAAPAATFLPTGQPVAATQVPSIVATGAPSSSATQPPSSSTTEMPSGAIVAGNSVKSTPFSVTYTLDPVNNPSEASFNEVADLTLAYLQSYFESFFGDTPFSVLIKFFGSQVGNTGTGDPARIGFDVTAIFTDDSEIVPSQSDIDVLIDTALSEPAVQALLDQLRALGVQNPFSNTVTVDYSTDNIPTATVNSQVSMNENVEGSNAPSSVVFLISAATAVAVFAAIIIVMVHRRRANAAKTERDCFKAEAVEAAEKAEKYVDCRGAMCSTGTFSRKGGAASFCGTSSVEPKDCDTVSSEENPVE